MTEDQFSAYRTAKSTRPAWANALLIAAILFGAGVIFVFTSGFGIATWFFVGALIAAVTAGVLALVKVGS